MLRPTKPFFLNVFFVIGAMAGCQSFAPAPMEADFDVLGRLAFRNSTDGFSASFRWVQIDDAFDIELWGAFGQGRTRVTGSDDHVKIQLANGETRTGRDATTLMRAELGWSVPLSVLPAWVQGRPAERYPTGAVERDDEGRIEAFEQLGWQIRLSAYDESPAGLPGRVTARRGDVKVTLLLKDWRRTPAAG